MVWEKARGVIAAAAAIADWRRNLRRVFKPSISTAVPSKRVRRTRCIFLRNVVPLPDTLKGNFVRKVTLASKDGAIEIVGTAAYVTPNTRLVVDSVEGLPRWVKNETRRAADFGGLFEE
jgi:hypothetical protein